MRAWEKMVQIARTDATFTRLADGWSGKCLICNGRLRFGRAERDGVDIEHIVARSAGGTDAPANLALTHRRCNQEKGRNWDTPRARRERAAEYRSLIERLQTERARRWREPEPG